MTNNQWQAAEKLLTNNDSGRRGHNPRFIAVHTTEGGDNARGVVEWQQKPESRSSYHVVIDRSGHSYRSNDDAFIPWAAGTTGNKYGLHVALAGRAAFTREQWLDRPQQLATLADYLRHTAPLNAIPLVKIGPADLRRDTGRGVCGHDDISKAWHEVDHWDPGPGFPWDHVLKLAGAQQVTGGARIHVVMPGDTLAAIAREHGTTWQALAHINSIPDPDRIRTGTVLKLAV